MNTKNIATMGFRILAVYLISDGIVRMWGFLSLRLISISRTPFNHILLFMMLIAISPILIGIILWILAPFIGKWAVNKDTGEKSAVPLNSQSLLDIGLIAIGIIFLCFAIPNILGTGYSTLVYKQQPYLLQNNYFISEVIRAVLGILLVLGAKPFARLIYRLRQ